eukprot:CAMPEP_0184698174 /NCGR_PEP_ID=MMETSP0313-20130426/4889_1 /TAXON_ID=2792 /ORGANISM="Porphyridium aerugineum, Strain SAG 1380-2" /LENGTH=505 /DNA_ID=CAMNT_0027157079 /DNA_START=208 /DNA_END=1722 /DNA_ORIENTATION=+
MSAPQPVNVRSAELVGSDGSLQTTREVTFNREYAQGSGTKRTTAEASESASFRFSSSPKKRGTRGMLGFSRRMSKVPSDKNKSRRSMKQSTREFVAILNHASDAKCEGYVVFTTAGITTCLSCIGGGKATFSAKNFEDLITDGKVYAKLRDAMLGLYASQNSVRPIFLLATHGVTTSVDKNDPLLIHLSCKSGKYAMKVNAASEVQTWLTAFEKSGKDDFKTYYKLGTFIAQGTMAEVFKGTDIKTNDKFAVKIMPHTGDEYVEISHMREIEVMKKLSHPNIVSIRDVFQNHSEIIIVMDYMKGGSLADYLEDRITMPFKEALHVMREVFSALEYLHKRNVIHRDLRPCNILLSKKKFPYDIKVSDFAVSKILVDEETDKEGNSELKRTMTMVGTPAFLAPEVLKSKQYGYASDIWAAGVLFFLIIAGEYPLLPGRLNDKVFDPNAVYAAIEDNKLTFDVGAWRSVNQETMDLITACLNKDPTKRISAADACNHVALKDNPRPLK